MPTGTVTNTAVSEQVAGGNSFTVPSGEVWRVAIQVSPNANCWINGVRVSNSTGDYNTPYPQTVLVGGDTVESATESVHISGFKVGSAPDYQINNSPVSVQVAPGGSTTVPTGETWRVGIILSANADSYINNNRITNSTGTYTPPFYSESVLVDGDTVSCTGEGAHIGGFVVN